MKLINKIVTFLSLASIGLTQLEAKSLEFYLDHTPHEIFDVQANIPNQNDEQPLHDPSSSSLNIQQLKVENIGKHPIKKCFPYINHPPIFSIDNLAFRLAHKKQPLIALYQLWSRSLIRNDSLPEDQCHPLDLLNFKGTCSTETFKIQFVKLCNLLGIETRLANVQGQSIYDFCFEDDWNLLDLTNQQLYLGLNNERLVSSEEIMDDPFLALRTKHHRYQKEFDIREGWKQLAHFEILEPRSAQPIVISSNSLKNRAQGIDLYPQETLVFASPAIDQTLALHERSIQHTIQLKPRKVSLSWSYQSPFPIQKLTNKSGAIIWLSAQKKEIKPGETFAFGDHPVFHVDLVFSDIPTGQLIVSGVCSANLFPSLTKGKNRIGIVAKKNPSIVRLSYEVDEILEPKNQPSVKILNSQNEFNYCSPSFLIERSSEEVDKVWWQISSNKNFQLVISNFDQVETFNGTITLPLISETFLNPGEVYYFRVKGCHNGVWGDWSSPYKFSINKPIAVEEVEFDQISENEYELNWERRAEETSEPIEYYIFGSNSLDFVPSIYCDKQVNSIVDGEVVEEEINDNLVAIATEPKFKINGSLAYYRIIAKQHGQFSVPSTLIRVYDHDLIQPRNVLQTDEESSGRIAKRMLFAPSYPDTEISLPHIKTPQDKVLNLIEFQLLLRSASLGKQNKVGYELPIVSDEIWEEVRPYLLPENHPAWAKLNRVFCKSRATRNPETFKRAGFKRWRPGRWSRVSASSHPEFNEYFIKAYCDCEVGIIYDWRKWIHRIKGAESIRECIKTHKLQKQFKVPRKWIYPLPKHPSPPKTSHYLRKNFILVCENMRIQDHDRNEKMYKKNMTKKLIDGLYTILQICGLYDSVYSFNIPFCKDGRIAVIDTEYHHKWPVPFAKLTHSFSKEVGKYWDRITYKGGKFPDGENQQNPPRMDRRDVQVVR